MKAGAEELTVFVDSATHLDLRRAERDIQKEQPGHPSPRVNNFFAPGQAVLCTTVWRRVETLRLI